MKKTRLVLTVFLMFSVLAAACNGEAEVNPEKKPGNTQDYNREDFYYFNGGFLDPFEEMKRMRKEMNKMFDDSFERMMEEREQRLSGEGSTAGMKMDMKNERDKITVKLDIPGAERASIKVDVKDNMLTISAKREEQREEKKNGEKAVFLKRERSMTAYKRSIKLPEGADASGIKTEYKDGVLTVVIPKKEEKDYESREL